MADIANLYYIEKKTQSHIARAFGYSRSAISRLLNEAHQEEIIKIAIDYPLVRDSILERRLIEKFHLEAAFVINTGQADYTQTLQMVGRLGARYLEQNLRDNMVVGIGWGASLFGMVNSMSDLPLSGVRVVQVVGASGRKSDSRIDGPDLAAFLASKLNASHQFLHSPLYLDSRVACDTLKSQEQIKDTFTLAYQSDLVLLGVGTIDVNLEYFSLYRTGFLNKDDVDQIKKMGGIGNICNLIIDEKGCILDVDINHRVMAVDLQALKNNGRKIIGIAAGSRKSQAIKAVLAGGWLDVLITNQSAVNSIAA